MAKRSSEQRGSIGRPRFRQGFTLVARTCGPVTSCDCCWIHLLDAYIQVEFGRGGHEREMIEAARSTALAVVFATTLRMATRSDSRAEIARYGMPT